MCRKKIERILKVLWNCVYKTLSWHYLSGILWGFTSAHYLLLIFFLKLKLKDQTPSSGRSRIISHFFRKAVNYSTFLNNTFSNIKRNPISFELTLWFDIDFDWRRQHKFRKIKNYTIQYIQITRNWWGRCICTKAIVWVYFTPYHLPTDACFMLQ